MTFFLMYNLDLISLFLRKPAYPFAVERDVIAQVEAARKQTFEAEEAFKLLKKQYQEEKLNQRKAAARKIAPGFLDTDTRILKPEQTYVQEFPMHPNNTSTEDEAASSNTSPHTLQPYVNYDKAFTAESGPDKVKTTCIFYMCSYFAYLTIFSHGIAIRLSQVRTRIGSSRPLGYTRE